MRATVIRRVGLTLATMVATAAIGATPAVADGYCGHDPTGPSACPIAHNGTVTGQLALGPFNELDYFVFYARPGTRLTLTINDTENPTCSTSESSLYCGKISVELIDSQGTRLDESDGSSPVNGIPVPASITDTLHHGGTYYAVASGYTNSEPMPYTITADGSPSVWWPAPCIVPRVRGATSLRAARHDLRRARCTPGRVHYERDRRVPAGDVIGYRPRTGSALPRGSRIEIKVSGRRP